jgi:adenylate cyclase class IV
MPSNVEIKARAEDLADVRRRALAAGARPTATLDQVDTFFHVPSGRLKLRETADGRGELIFYHRPDATGPSRSDYAIVPTGSPGPLRALLGDALGSRGVVAKRRELLLLGQTRIHLDEVRGLGSFVELEVVLREEQTTRDGEEIAREILDRLGISAAALVAGAYVDLLTT